MVLGASYDVSLSKTEDVVLERLHRDAVFVLQLIELNVGGKRNLVVVVVVVVVVSDRLFGQRPRRGRSPVEHRGTFVRSFVRLLVLSSPP